MNGVRAAVHHSNRRSDSRKLFSMMAIAVGRSGGGDGAEVHDGVELAAVEPAQQIGRRHEFGELAAGEIAPFAVAAEHIVDGNVGAAGLVEARDHIRSDEAGPAGDQQHRRRKTG